MAVAETGDLAVLVDVVAEVAVQAVLAVRVRAAVEIAAVAKTL